MTRARLLLSKRRLSVVCRDSRHSTAAASSFTFPDVDFGVAAASRQIYVGLVQSNTGYATSVTVADETAILANRVASGGNPTRAEFWRVALPTGETGSVTVNFPGSTDDLGIGIWSVTGAKTPTGYATAGGDPAAQSIALAAGGGAVIGIGSIAQPAVSAVWTGITENFDNCLTRQHSGASADFTAGGTVNVSLTGNTGSTSGAILLFSFR